MYEGKWTALTVRKTFLNYFAERGHTIGTMRKESQYLYESISGPIGLTVPLYSALLLGRPPQ